jgi:RNA polymerase sigma-70 factor (ECF subfamily)
MNDDIELVEKAKAGDRRAFDKLMRKYRKPVYYMLLKMVKNTDDAEDLTQEAFTKAFSSIGRFDPQYRFSTWLFRIANNNCIDYIRKKRLTTISINQPNKGGESNNTPIDLPNTSITSSKTDYDMEKKERIRFLLMAMEQLPEKLQQLLKFRYFSELSYEEISAEMTMPLGTVKAQLYRARELLGDTLKFLEDEFKDE